MKAARSAGHEIDALWIGGDAHLQEQGSAEDVQVTGWVSREEAIRSKCGLLACVVAGSTPKAPLPRASTPPPPGSAPPNPAGLTLEDLEGMEEEGAQQIDRHAVFSRSNCPTRVVLMSLVLSQQPKSTSFKYLGTIRSF